MEDFLTLDDQLCFAIYQTSSEFNKLYSKALHPFGITYPQYLLLLALWEEDGLTVKELGERLHLGTGTLTPMIKRLEANGWVKRERSTKDERRVCVCLEQKAIKAKEPITIAVANEVMACNIELDEYRQLMSQLNILHEKLLKRNRG